MSTDLGHWLAQQLPENRLHLLRHQPSYFAKGGEVQRLVAWLTDFGFLAEKLAALGVTALVDDYDLALPLVSAAEQRILQLIQGALRLSAHVLAEDNSQLAGQLWGRLLSFPEPEIQALLQQAQQWQSKLWLRPLTPCLDSPDGALIRTLSGHSRSVNAVAIAPDGKLAISGSWDNTLKVWEVAAGREIRTLSGHSNSVRAVAIAPDGKLAISGSDDNTLKVWEVATGREICTLSGHSRSVTAVAIAPDGKVAISGSNDRTLKVWEVSTGREIRTLSGHSGSVYAVDNAEEGKVASSGSSDKGL